MYSQENWEDPSFEQVDDFMQKARNFYFKTENIHGVQAELSAYTRVNAMKGEKAERVKTTMLSPSKAKRATDLIQTDKTLQTNVQTKQTQFDQYMIGYYQTIRDDGIEQADATKEDYALELDRAKSDYRQNKILLDAELANLNQSFSERLRNYENAKIENSNQNTIAGMNKVITDISIAYPDYSPQASRLNQQIHLLYENYNIDMSYSEIVNNLMVDLSNNSLSKVERELQYKKKQIEIQEYYAKNYQQQIIIFKILLIISLVALFGGLLLNYQLISVSLFTVYLGTVLALGFIVLFYFLWDFYLRDNTDFDEYNFMVYHPPPKPKLERDSLITDSNVAYCDE